MFPLVLETGWLSRVDLCRLLTATAQLIFYMAEKPNADRGAKADDKTFAGVMDMLRVRLKLQFLCSFFIFILKTYIF